MTDAELKHAIEDYTALLVAHGRPYASLLETGKLPQVPAVQRQLLARWMDEQRYRSHKGCVAVAFVTASPLSRGLLTAVLWLTTVTLHYPIRTFAHRDEALPWLRAELAGAAGKPPRRSSAP